MVAIARCGRNSVAVLVASMMLAGCDSRQQPPTPRSSERSAGKTDGASGVEATADGLFDAVNSGDLATTRSLCASGVDVHTKNKDGMTTLHRAAVKGHAPIARVLIEHGADATAQDDRGWTALHIACMKGHAEVVS